METVAVSYCHSDGRSIAAALVAYLRETLPTVRVEWDGNLKDLSPASVPQWIHHTFSNAAVIVCIATPEYNRFFGPWESGTQHRGVVAEARIVLSRLYEQQGPDQCPVIPVIGLQQPIEGLPQALRMIVAQRIEVGTGTGLPELTHRIDTLATKVREGQTQHPPPVRDTNERHGDHDFPGDERQTHPATADPDAAANSLSDAITSRQRRPAGPATPTNSPRPAPVRRGGGHYDRDPIQQAIAHLEATHTSLPDALQAVHAWLDLGPTVPRAVEFAHGFRGARPIIRAAGDFDLMRVAVDECLRRLDSPELHTIVKQCKASLLICGRAWHLSHEGHTKAAIAATQEGIDLAQQASDMDTVAHGELRLAELWRQRAEETRTDQRQCCDHLDTADRSAQRALRRFTRDGHPGNHAHGRHALAKVAYSRFTLLGDKNALRDALGLTENSTSKFPDDPEYLHSRVARRILSAEINIDLRRFTQAREHLRRADTLLAPYTQDQHVLHTRQDGRRHLAHARLGLAEGGPSLVDAAQRARQAQTAFRAVGPHSRLQESTWIQFQVTAYNALRSSDVRWLATHAPDLALRVTVGEEFVKLLAQGHHRFPWTRRRLLQSALDSIH